MLAARYFKEQQVTLKASEKKTPAKNTYFNKKAQVISSYIINTLKLPDTKGQFLLKILTEKYDYNTGQIKGKNLSQAEKKVIYKKTFSDTRKKLSTQFTKKEIAEIEKLERSKQKNINNN